jgi:hypothetical protein
MLSCHGFQFLSLYTAVHFTELIIIYDRVSAEFLGGMMVNPLNTELNSICKSHLAELFCGVLKFCAWFSKNLTKCSHTNMAQNAFHD